MQDASDYPVDHLAGGPDPVLVLVLGAVIIGLMIAAYLLGRNFENRRAAFDHRRSAQDIHTAIARWAVGASKASSGELLSYAQGLLDEIEGRIGPAHILAKGSGAHITELKAALAGKTPEKPKTEPAKTLAETTVLMPALVSAGGYDGDHREVLTPGFCWPQLLARARSQRRPTPPNGTIEGAADAAAPRHRGVRLLLVRQPRRRRGPGPGTGRRPEGPLPHGAPCPCCPPAATADADTDQAHPNLSFGLHGRIRSP